MGLAVAGIFTKITSGTAPALHPVSGGTTNRRYSMRICSGSSVIRRTSSPSHPLPAPLGFGNKQDTETPLIENSRIQVRRRVGEPAGHTAASEVRPPCLPPFAPGDHDEPAHRNDPK